MKLKPGQNNLFRGLNGPRSGIERDMWVPLEKKTIKHKSGRMLIKTDDREELLFFLVFILFASFLDLRKSYRWNSSSKERKVLYATRTTRGYQKHWIFLRIQVKIRKIQIFSFYQIYGILVVIIFRTNS